MFKRILSILLAAMLALLCVACGGKTASPQQEKHLIAVLVYDLDDPEVRAFIRSLDKTKVGKIVNFGSAAMLNSTWKKVKAEADKAGIPMADREFHCKGEFKGIHKGRPNDEDLAAAAAFAKSMVQ